MSPFCLGKQQFLIDRINLLFSLNRYVWLTLVVLVDHHLFVAAKTWSKNHHSCERKKNRKPWRFDLAASLVTDAALLVKKRLEHTDNKRKTPRGCHKPRSPRLQWDVKQTWNL